jgi:hypothetical protein
LEQHAVGRAARRCRRGRARCAGRREKWAELLLSDARGGITLRRFHEQTYHTGSYGGQSKDARFGFDETLLAPYLQQEARLLFEEVVAEGGGIAAILTKPVAFVNEHTAPFYGLTGITGAELQRVSLDPSLRAGLLTQVGFLAQTGARTLTDPVHRGLTVLKQVLCDDPDPPPPVDIQTPAVESGMTTRATYEQVTACGPGCHDTLINPPDQDLGVDAGCGHAAGGLMCLTAAKADGHNIEKALAMGESIESHRARAAAAGRRAAHAARRRALQLPR